MKIRVVANAHSIGGGEMSVGTIMRLLIAEGHTVVFHPTERIHPNFPLPESAERGPRFDLATETGCDALFFYANNFIYKIPAYREQWQRFLRGAARRVMCLNFDISHAADPWFRREWHKVLFLNTTKERQFPANGVPTRSLAPAVDLQPYLSVQPDYGRLNLIRHSKRFKHCDDEVRIACRVRDIVPEAHFWFMAPPVGIARKHADHPRFHLFDAFSTPTWEFLQNGSLFWYRLAPHMKDQGPRVIVEAMAAGLPCIVDDRDGAKDRVTDETGWKCRDNDEYVRVIESVRHDLSLLEEKGRNARQRAKSHFDSRNWLREIVDG